MPDTSIGNPPNSKRLHPLFSLTLIVLAIVMIAEIAYLTLVKISKKPDREENTPAQTTASPTKIPYHIVDPQSSWAITYIKRLDMQYIEDIKLTNTETQEERIIGRIFTINPGNHAVFSADKNTIIFLGVESPDSDKLETEDISFYSIPDNQITHKITLGDIKNTFPDIEIPRNAALNSIILSPSGDRIALSYGDTKEIDTASDIFVIDTQTYEVTTTATKGIVKKWIDDSTIQYQTLETVGETTEPVLKETTI